MEALLFTLRAKSLLNKLQEAVVRLASFNAIPRTAPKLLINRLSAADVAGTMSS